MEHKNAATAPEDPFCGLRSPQIDHRSDGPEILLRPEVHLRQARLATVISSEIIPRLLLIHHPDTPAPRALGPEEIAEFAELAMSADNQAAHAYFDKLRALGHSLDTLFVHFLAPTARYLGELWEQDRCDFVDVTIGVGRLQELLTIFGSVDEEPIVEHDHRALLVTMPGERHMFGIDMVARLMREAQWQVCVATGREASDYGDLVASEWFGVIGVTMSDESNLQSLGRTIECVRRKSINSAVGVMVGGPAFLENPGLGVQAGADGVAADALAAVILAKKLLIQMARKKATRR